MMRLLVENPLIDGALPETEHLAASNIWACIPLHNNWQSCDWLQGSRPRLMLYAAPAPLQLLDDQVPSSPCSILIHCDLHKIHAERYLPTPRRRAEPTRIENCDDVGLHLGSEHCQRCGGHRGHDELHDALPQVGPESRLSLLIINGRQVLVTQVCLHGHKEFHQRRVRHLPQECRDAQLVQRCHMLVQRRIVLTAVDDPSWVLDGPRHKPVF
mmetsp:Transcript_105967/g.274195  ORF Transcript_105967/g.274195 Transcript_105967/m.274195 type:complete len:213 (-) Transcript_105967:212-850(-)